MRVCFLIRGLPAPEPVDELSRRLGERHDVVLALTERLPPGAVTGAVPVAEAIAGDPFDVAIATDWTTTAHLFRLRATRYASWVDHFAHRRMGT